MTQREVKAVEFTCDGCGRIELVVDDFEILGLTGTVCEQTETGGSGTIPWFACKRSCVAKAVANAIDQAYT